MTKEVPDSKRSGATLMAVLLGLFAIVAAWLAVKGQWNYFAGVVSGSVLFVLMIRRVFPNGLPQASQASSGFAASGAPLMVINLVVAAVFIFVSLLIRNWIFSFIAALYMTAIVGIVSLILVIVLRSRDGEKGVQASPQS